MNSNLTLRNGTIDDIEKLGDFYDRLHHPGQSPWIAIMMDGRHPYTRSENFILVEDQVNGLFASCAVYMPWTYLYDGIPIPISRIEQVFTEPEYMGQGLMKAIFQRIHQISAARGDVMQVVYGRPGLYQHLGYTLGLPNEEEGFLVSFHDSHPEMEKAEFTICSSEDADLPKIVDLYRQASSRYAVCLHMGMEEFYYGKNIYPNETLDVVKNQAGETVGFIRFWNKNIVYALELNPAVSYYRFRASFLWHLKRTGIHQVALKLGESHPFYDVLDEYPKNKLLTLQGYARIADIPAFLRAVAPVLDKRLQSSAFAGFDGSLALCLYNKQECYRLTFENGRLADINPVAQDYGDAYIIRDRLIELFLGKLSLADLDRESADVFFTHPDYRRLFGILFPKKQSFIYSVN